jgi:protocatechuate 3,4-dioxygenase beta subunit
LPIVLAGGGLAVIELDPREVVREHAKHAAAPASEAAAREVPRPALFERRVADSAARELAPRPLPSADGEGRADVLVEQAHSDAAALRGEVVDARGGAVIGAAVTVRAASGALVATASSDADGKFALNAAPGVLELCAWAEAYSRTCSEVVAPSEGHVLTLAPEAVISGRVLTRGAGTPRAGVLVTATNVDGLRIPARAVTSREDGSFEIVALPPGGYDVVAVSADSRSNQEHVALGVGEASAPVTLWSSPAVSVSGVVLLDGTPCVQGSVELTGPIWARAGVAEGGAIRVDGVVPGHYELTAYCDPAPSLSLSLDVEHRDVERVWALERLPGSIDPGGAPSSEAPIGGTLIAEIDGSFAPTDAVFAEAQDGVPRRGVQRGSSFLFEDLPRGEYRVYVNDYFERAQQVRIADDPEPPRVRVNAGAPGWIRGRVEGKDGTPVADAWLSYFRSDSAMTAARAAAPTLTDDEGRFELAAVPGVPYTLSVTSPFGEARLEGVEAKGELVVRVSSPETL